MSPRWTEEQLSEKALSLCREHAGRAVRGEVRVETVRRKLAWDETRLLDVFTQAMTVWRRYGTFEVVLDEDGLVAGYVDHGGYEDSSDGELTEEEAGEIALAEKPVPPGARVVSVREHRPDERTRIVRVTVELRHPTAAYRRLEVEINPTRRTVIAVRPLVKPE